MANIFSFPTFVPTGVWVTTGYNVRVSRSVSGAPSYFGPWTTLFTNLQSNTDVFDASGAHFDLYQVQPIVTIGVNTGVTMEWSRPFYAWQTLYDVQISVLLDHFRRNFINDTGVPMTDSTLPTESTGAGTLPFISDASTTRFYLSFLPNTDPIKFVQEHVLVYTGASKAAAAPLVPYTDFYPAGDRGYIDFATPPASSNYLRVEYTNVRYTNDEIRNSLLNAVSALSLYGINGYEVKNSNNLLYLVTALPNRDLAEIVCHIASLNLLQAELISSVEASESWKNGSVQFTADPSRTIQATSLAIPNIKETIRNKANNYILNTRQYLVRGEYESFFDTTGILPIYTLFISQFNGFSFWLVFALVFMAGAHIFQTHQTYPLLSALLLWPMKGAKFNEKWNLFNHKHSQWEPLRWISEKYRRTMEKASKYVTRIMSPKQTPQLSLAKIRREHVPVLGSGKGR